MRFEAKIFRIFRAESCFKVIDENLGQHLCDIRYSDVVWDRRSLDKTGLRPKNRSWSWSWVSQVWYCFVKNDLVTLVVIMVLKDTATFQVLFIVSLFCVWNITTVMEINSSVHLLKKLNPPSAFVYLGWSWSCYFGLGLKNLVLFTSLIPYKAHVVKEPKARRQQTVYG